MSTRRREGFAGRWSLQHLAADRARHLDALLRHHHGAALPAPEVRRHALAVLALSARLARDVLAGRWVYATEALAAGAELGEVARAVELDEDEVRHGIRRWADNQARHGFLSEATRAEMLALLGTRPERGPE